MAHWESLPLLLVGLCVAALGLVALAVDPRGKPNRLFAAFLLLVAGNFAANWIAYAYADSLQDAALGIVSNPWYWVSHSLNLLDAAALLWFASAYPYPSAWERRARVRAAVACVLLAHVAYVLLDPVEASRGPMEAQTGRVVWIGLAEMALFVAAYLGALGLAVRSLVEAEFASTREVARPLVAGLLVAVSTRAGLVESDLRLFEHAGTAGSLVVRLGVTWLVFGAALLLLRREPADSRPATRPWIVAAAAMVGGVSAVWVLSALPTTPAQRLLASSLLYACRWVFFGAVVTYALARHAFLGAGPRMLAPLRSAQVLLVAAAVFVLLRLFLAPLEGHAPGGPSAGDALALGAACLFAVGLVARRGATARLPAGGDDALRARKLDAYRALVEASLEAGGRGEEPGLAAHRRRLGLTAQDHEDIVALALAERDAGESRGPRGALPPGYALEEVFPSGATAWTLLARDPGGRRVVVKTLRAEWRRHPRVAAAFLREGRILSAVRHPNVV
ncbi:MAG TPA: hypothetical protein VHH36_04545, partial [Candidatus Thermoplasmatota archaeon]|nr:hypothetical protein [Candidatus Thermoplasmatota archaeon]